MEDGGLRADPKIFLTRSMERSETEAGSCTLSGCLGSNQSSVTAGAGAHGFSDDCCLSSPPTPRQTCEPFLLCPSVYLKHYFQVREVKSFLPLQKVKGSISWIIRT